MTAEVALFLTIKTQPGQRDQLVALWEKHLKPRADANEAQVRYVIARDAADPDTLRITEVYATRPRSRPTARRRGSANTWPRRGRCWPGSPSFTWARRTG